MVDPQTAEAHYEKVHIRGVDEMTTDHIKQFALSYFPDEEASRIEWIDDTSANIVYSSDEVGLRALTALTQLGEEDISALPALRLRTAKTCLSHPESVLQVRSAVKTDRKKPRAHEASRFYLMHPEHDPRERLRRELAEKRRQGGRRDESDGDYRRLRFDDREHRRRRNRNDDGFTASMYDDDGATPDRRGASSDDYFSEPEARRRPRRGRRQPQELFPERGGSGSRGGSGRLRDRSASPGRDDLDAMRRSDDEQQQSRRRFRERSPRLASGSHANTTKELFPASDSQDTRELFPNRTAASFLKKELFPAKTNSNHRRTDAFDAADETADLFAKRISVPLVDGAQDQIYIKGASNDIGMALRGHAKGNTQAVKELFPDKYNANAGKELFSNKLEGRGGRRRRAEDMFQ